MKKILILLPVILLSSCTSKAAPIEEDLISLFNDSSLLIEEKLNEEETALLKTYHHKKYGEIPYVNMDEFVNLFKKTNIDEDKRYEIIDNKFYVYNNDDEAFIFDAKKDIVTTSKSVSKFFHRNRMLNNGIPFDLYRRKGFDKFVKESANSKYLEEGKERVYDLKKYNFDIVYEDGKYYAPFSVLSYLFYGFLNTTYIYNGKNFFDCAYITGEEPTSYCYSSNGDFLLDRTAGFLGSVLYKKVNPVEENESYRFENIIESSKQKSVFSLLNNGTGTLKSYDENGKLIDDGTYIKVNYTLNEKKTELEMKYFSVIDPSDTEPISETSTIRINLDETYFGKKTRSKIVADFTYQELRFCFYELYGNTKNNEIKDFDNFIKDKEYKDDLLSLDAFKYDEAMAKLLLQGVDDAHTTIQYPSIYIDPTFANANQYSLKFEGQRRGYITNTLIANTNKRKEAGLSEGLDIVNKTAFISFDKFEYGQNIKGFNEYKDTDPKDFNNPMELFASSFNKIKENKDVENVVIDLSCNGGGLVSCLSYLLGYLVKEPSIVCHFKLNDSIAEYHYEIDLDQDGIYNSDNDTFMGKYNFYVLTSSASFSCANHFATICRNMNFGKVIGEKNGGGSCVISYLATSSGYLYHSSSEWTSLLKENDEWVTNDNGVTPDIELSSEYFYNHAYIDNLLSNN